MIIETPKKPASKPAEDLSRFRPDMPNIPGVNDVSASSVEAARRRKQIAKIGGLSAVALLAVVAVLWWAKSASRRAVFSDAEMPGTTETSPASAAQQGTSSVEAPKPIATAEELGKTWSAKKFVFVKPFTHESVNAIVIRLPGKGLWAFSLQEPYGHCGLEFETDLGKLANQYKFRATHPMVVNPCNNTIYDPTKVGPLSNGVWARGEIVQGTGLRPPLSINVLEKDQSIVADRME
jgi:hypothetical protein